MLNPVTSLTRFLGLGGERSAPPPRLQAIADGLLITSRAAEAWYVLETANTDLASEDALDGVQDQATNAISKLLADRHCHLKVLWGRVSGEAYEEEVDRLFVAGDYRDWTAVRAARIDALNLPQRHLLLGVQIAEREGSAVDRARSTADEVLGLGTWTVTRAELSQLDGRARKLGRLLAQTTWRAKPAPAETIAWMVGREQHRGAAAAPRAGLITGAALARLTQGRVLPYSDHLRFLAADGSTRAYAAVLTLTSFPETLHSPGEADWLRTLSDITYVTDDDDQAAERPVLPDASVRFSVMDKRAALRMTDEARRLAKEQRQSAAKHSAEETDQEIQETEAAMGDLKRGLQRTDRTLVQDHPRLVVTASSRAELDTYVDAVIRHYGERGIDAVVGEEEQRDLWLETLAGDQLRVPDLGHIRDATALAGSLFWGGCRVGDDTGPAFGVLTGSTPGLVRNDVTAGSSRGDATTTLYVGRSGRGKTTAMMLAALDAAFLGSWVALIDLKGDCGGAVAAADAYGLPSRLMRVGKESSGVADLFRSMPVSDAVLEVVALLILLAPKDLRAGAEAPVLAAARAVAEHHDPSTWKVIQRLANGTGHVGELGRALAELAQTPLGAPVAGPPVSDARLTTEPGLWVIQIPGVALPSPETSPDEWTVTQRLSLAAFRGFVAHAISTTGRLDLRGLPKVVAIPEVHLLTATNDGRRFVDYTARVGRALATNLLIDTQDPASITHMPGLVEQITTVFGFQLTTGPQQDALAALLHLPVSKETRALIREIGWGEDGEIRHGHCIMRDRRDNAATVQWDYPSLQVKDLLSTTPRRVTSGITTPIRSREDEVA